MKGLWVDLAQSAHFTAKEAECQKEEHMWSYDDLGMLDAVSGLHPHDLWGGHMEGTAKLQLDRLEKEMIQLSTHTLRKTSHSPPDLVTNMFQE